MGGIIILLQKVAVEWEPEQNVAVDRKAESLRNQACDDGLIELRSMSEKNLI